MLKRVLLVEDDKNISNILTYNLKSKDYEVVECDNGNTAVEIAREGNFSVIIMDIMINGISGIESLAAIRSFSDIPIIIVSALDTEEDKLSAFENGADDYVTKPYSIKELVVRMELHISKYDRIKGMEVVKSAEQVVSNGNVDNGLEVVSEVNSVVEDIDVKPEVASSIAVGVVDENIVTIREGVVFNKEFRTLFVNGKVSKMGKIECDLLSYFIDNANCMLSKEQLLNDVWGYNMCSLKTLGTMVCRIRKKIEKNPTKPKILCNTYGSGYYFCL